MNEYDCLFAASEIVAKYKNIKLVKPPLTAESGNLLEYLEAVAENTEIRMRKVSLQGKWWREDGGALLGFYNNSPCALLPKKTGGYYLIDIKQRKRITVSVEIAIGLASYAFYFYPALPLKVQRLRDLLSFSFRQVKTDYKRFLGVQALVSLFGLVVPIALGYVFNHIIPNIDLQLLWQVIILLGINTLVIILFSIVQMVALMRFRFKLEAIITPAVWDRILKIPLRFFRRFSAGDFAFRARIISEVQTTITQSSLWFFADILTLLFMLGLLMYYSLRLACMALILAIIIGCTTALINFWQLVLMRRVYYYFGQWISFLIEVITGIAKIRVANATERIFILWRQRLEKSSTAESSMKSYRLGLEVFMALMTVINPLVLYALVPWLGNKLSFGDFVTFNTAYTLFFITLLKAIADWGDVVRVVPLWRRARTLLTTKIEREIDHSDPGELSGEIILRNIVFRYHINDRPLFKDLSLTIHPGEFVAIVGPSGSGKSTLFRLMLGFEEAESGEVYYNGINLRTLKLAAVRKQIGVVIQNSTLIPGTIFDNIAGNSTTMTRIQAWEIADKVGLAALIKNLPMQMDTLITEGAITLSGGEAQRLILARALAQQPKILILDEATSALDNTTQAVVHNYLKQLQATQVIAAHRLSTIVNADRIIVIEKGAIVQTGNFSELMSQPGLFAQMAKRQL